MWKRGLRRFGWRRWRGSRWEEWVLGGGELLSGENVSEMG